MTFRTTRRVEFRDTDAAGIVHFSVFFTYMEQAEHELLRSLGFSVMQPDGDKTIGWPRVSATCDYQGAVRFEDVLDVEVSIVHLGTKSIRYRHEFGLDGKTIATGEIVAVCCRIDESRKLTSTEIPADMRKKLTPHLIDTTASDV